MANLGSIRCFSLILALGTVALVGCNANSGAATDSGSANPGSGSGGSDPGGTGGGIGAGSGGTGGGGARDAAVDSPPIGALCGRPGEACCPGAICGAGGCCVNSVCVANGGMCSALLGMCTAGACVADSGRCGGAGDKCCGSTCTAPNTRCDSAQIATICRACGLEAGQPCCTTSLSSFSRGVCTGASLACGDQNLCTPCGQPGQPCCENSICSGGACCQNSNVISSSTVTQGYCIGTGTQCGGTNNGVCNAGRCAGCGGRGQPCCGGVCQEPQTLCSSASRVDAVCSPCGMPGSPCCAGTTQCAGSAICLANICNTCGGPGEPCCGGGSCKDSGCCFSGRCVPDGQGCSIGGSTVTYGMCQKGRCGCGQAGQPCCPASSSTTGTPSMKACETPDTVCSSTGVCTKCGVVGGPCCAGSLCNDAGVACDANNTCIKCGTPRGPCCAGSKCDGDGCCSAGVCRISGEACGSPTYGTCTQGACSCGKLQLACCVTGKACTDADTVCSGTPTTYSSTTCLKCGMAGGPCCPGNRCAGGCCVAGSSGTATCVAAGQTCAGGTTCGGDGSCGSCGGSGQTCCQVPLYLTRFCSAPGTTCSLNAATTPSTYTCRACGDAGQPCCAATGTSSSGSCNGVLACAYSSLTATYLCR